MSAAGEGPSAGGAGKVSVFGIYGGAFLATVHNLHRLLLLTAAPLAGYLVTSAGLAYLSVLRRQEFIAGLKQQGQLGSEALSGAIRANKLVAMAVPWEIYPLTAVIWLLIWWLGLRVVRWHLAQRGFRPVASELRSYLGTCLYSLVLYGILLSVPYLAALVWGYIKFGESFPAAWYMMPVMLMYSWPDAAVGFCIGLLSLYASTRFAVAMPAVMLGHRPNIFRGMWPFARSITWRFIGVGILYGLGIGIALAVLMIPIGMLVFRNLYGLEAVNVVINIPFFWFTAILFAEAYAELAIARGRARAAVRAPEGEV